MSGSGLAGPFGRLVLQSHFHKSGDPSVETAAGNAQSPPPRTASGVGEAGDDRRPDFVPFLPRFQPTVSECDWSTGTVHPRPIGEYGSESHGPDHRTSRF